MHIRPTIIDFKKQYAKVFKFQPYGTWDALNTYSLNDKVLYLNLENYKWGIYKSKIDANDREPNDSTAWDLTNESVKSFVMDIDIEEAMKEAETMCPQDAVLSKEDYAMIFLLLTAHFVVTDWQAMNQGINAAGAGGILVSRTVGKMSASYAVSTLLQMNPTWQIYLTTYWGIKAMSILARYNVGNLVGVQGMFTNY